MKKRIEMAKDAAKGFLQTLNADDKVGILRFSRDVKVAAPLGSSRAEAEAAIGAFAARGDTALYDAIYTSLESLKGVSGRKAVIALSDGENTKASDAYYSITLPAGDYKTSVEFQRADKASGNVGGSVTALGTDGGQLESVKALSVNEIAPTGKASAKLSLADEEAITFRIRAKFTKATAIFSVEKWEE